MEFLDLSVVEGEPIRFEITARGFSYSGIPVAVTPVACSEYPGNLSATFDNVPEDSADPGTYVFNVTPHIFKFIV